MNRYSIIFLFLLIITSCDFKTHESVNVEEFNRGKEAFKIKRVTDDQLVNAAYTFGDSISTIILDSLGDLTSDSLCGFRDLKPLLKDKKLQELIEKATIRCMAEDNMHEKEKEVWEAYLNGYNQQVDLQNAIQRLGTKEKYDELLFARPLSYQYEDSTKFAMLSIILAKKHVIMTF